MDIKKRKINHIAAVVIVHDALGRIFLEIKTADYPRKVFANKCLIIGGNWIGEKAKDDIGPFGTMCREVDEEISFEKPIINYKELNELLSENRLDGYRVKSSDWKPSAGDQRGLEAIKYFIKDHARPFGDFEFFIPEEIFKRGEPEYSKGGIGAIVSVWDVELSLYGFDVLVELQQRSGNLSNESLTIVVSANEIMEKGLPFAWGQDQIIKRYLLSRGYRGALDFPVMPGITVEYCGFPLKTYDDYLKFYDIDKRP